jgi:hypothetical protein
VQLGGLFKCVCLAEQALDVDLVNEVAAHVPHKFILSKNYFFVHDSKALVTVLNICENQSCGLFFEN